MPHCHANPAKLTVCYILAYHQAHYVRTLTLLAALEQMPEVNLISARNRDGGLRRYWQTLTALTRHQRNHQPDLYILGFRGHEIFWPVRWLTRGRPLIFDSFVSPSDALLSERKWGPSGRLFGWFIRAIEKRILKRSDYLLTDTNQHRRFFIEHFGVTPGKIDHVYVGANPVRITVDHSHQSANHGQPLQVLFYGTFLPLHGVDIIVEAAKYCADLPIEFTLIGGRGRHLKRFTQAMQYWRPGNIKHHAWVAYDTLLTHHIPLAGICLGGPFGGTDQAHRVITGKTFEFLAQGKPTVIGRNAEPAGFIDRENCLLVEQGDAHALAQALRWAVNHRSQLVSIGTAGQRLYRQRYDTAAIVAQLRKIIGRVVSTNHS